MSNRLPTYAWQQSPDHLKTRRQLKDMGLRPGGPAVALLRWGKGRRDQWAALFDVAQALPKKEPTAAQLAALEAARAKQRTCWGCGNDLGFVIPRRWRPEHDCPHCHHAWITSARDDARNTARLWLASDRSVILDTETTDLYGFLVQIAIIRAKDGAVLLDTLVNPETEISAGAQAVHGITAEQLTDAPTWPAIRPRVEAALRGRRIITYNAAFDRGILQNEIARAGGDGYDWSKRQRWRCAMELWAQYIGDWSDYHGDFRWYPLHGGDHSALGDAVACRNVLGEMARSTQGAPNES